MISIQRETFSKMSHANVQLRFTGGKLTLINEHISRYQPLREKLLETSLGHTSVQTELEHVRLLMITLHMKLFDNLLQKLHLSLRAAVKEMQRRIIFLPETSGLLLFFHIRVS